MLHDRETVGKNATLLSFKKKILATKGSILNVNMFVGMLNSSASIFPFTTIYITLFHLPSICKMHIGSLWLLQHCVCLMTSALNPPVKLLSQYGCRAALRASSDVRLWTTSRESEESDGWRGPHWQRADAVTGLNPSFLRRARWSNSQTARSKVPGEKKVQPQNSLNTGMKHSHSE